MRVVTFHAELGTDGEDIGRAAAGGTAGAREAG
jgi:hypothetical protein